MRIFVIVLVILLVGFAMPFIHEDDVVRVFISIENTILNRHYDDRNLQRGRND